MVPNSGSEAVSAGRCHMLLEVLWGSALGSPSLGCIAGICTHVLQTGKPGHERVKPPAPARPLRPPVLLCFIEQDTRAGIYRAPTEYRPASGLWGEWR